MENRTRRNVARIPESMFKHVEKFGLPRTFLLHELHWRSPPLCICLCPLHNFTRLWPTGFYRSDVAQWQSARLSNMWLWVQLPLKLVFHSVNSKVADTLSLKRDAGVHRRLVNSTLLKNSGSFTVHYQIITYCSNNSVTSQVYTNDW